jgi:O-antigen ligase
MNMKRILSTIIDIFIVITAFTMTNLTAFSPTEQFPPMSNLFVLTWIGVVAGMVVLIFIQLKFLSVWDEYKKAWKKQLPLIIFIAFCICTLLWSVYLIASVYELTAMVFATLIGVYLAVRYMPETGFEMLRYFGIFSVLASFLLLLAAPSLARLDNPVFNGAWRGIFWHRNHLGSLMAFFSAVFLIKAALVKHLRVQLIVNAALFVLSAILIFGSRSATGILIFFILTGLLILTFLWLKLRHHLKKNHYVGLAIVGGLIIILLLFNLNFIFSLVGRDTSLAGRIPLWIDLISRTWTAKPILGYGFGALWNQEAFRISMQTRLGWRYPVYFGDNGYLDILLNTGLIGLSLFVVFFVITGARCGRVFMKSSSLMGLVPLLIFVYVLLANISYSFLLEVDQFVWMLLVVAAILSVRMLDVKSVPNNKISNPQP